VLELVRLLEAEDKPVRLQVGAATCAPPWMASSSPPSWWMAVSRTGAASSRGSDKALIAGREDLRQAFARAAILSNEKFRGVRLNLQENLLRITANNPEQEEAEELLDVQYAAGEMEIGFNVSYVLDVLNTLKCDQIRISLSDSISSAIIEDFENQDAQYVVMPMRI
jgi:DNA polymerase-3 subunit beta